MYRQSGIVGRGRGFKASRDIDARLREWCQSHPLRLPEKLVPHDAATLLGVPENTLTEAMCDGVAQ